jgi:hypothetical protein
LNIRETLIHLQKYPVISHYFGNVQILEFVEFLIKARKGKAILVAGHGGPQGCEMLRLPHFLDNRHTDGSALAGFPLPPEDPWYFFLLEAEFKPELLCGWKD